jgi:hypothetical protein
MTARHDPSRDVSGIAARRSLVDTNATLDASFAEVRHDYESGHFYPRINFENGKGPLLNGSIQTP